MTSCTNTTATKVYVYWRQLGRAAAVAAAAAAGATVECIMLHHL